MTRRPTLLAVVAVASATLALGHPALAGGGVRLNFGGPLGTFVATPTPGYGGGSGYSSAKPKVRTAKAAPSPKHATVDKANHSQTRTTRQAIPVRHTVSSSAPKAIPVTSSEAAAPGLLGRTLAFDSLPRAETVRVLPPSESITARDGEDLQTATADAAPAGKAKAANIAVADSPATCRRFIPAVGVTVTVACD